MSITIAGAGTYPSLRIGSSGSSRAAPSAGPPAAPDLSQAARDVAAAHRQVTELREALGAFDLLVRDVRPKRAGVASAASGADLGLSTSPTPTFMRSVEEVNTAATSFTPNGPDWVGSTAQATIGGTYDGAQGTGTLTFRVDRDGTHGVDDIKVKVYDSLGDNFDTIDVDKEDPLDQEYVLTNGLTLTLGAGLAVDNDTFTVDVVAGLPTSYGPTAPAWSASTAAVSVDGVYDGSIGTDTLTFRVDGDGTHGADNLKIKVYDSLGEELEVIEIRDDDPIDQVYTLSNGLELTLGAGDLLKDTTFTVAVDAGTGTAVDPSKPMNGTGDDDAHLDDTFVVADGAFTVNGASISVSASDSIDDVLDRITASAAGVTASFDAASEQVVLTQKTPGAANDIVLGADTSGFLAATKLAGAASVPGDAGVPLADASLEDFSTMSSGDFTVNGVTIAIDTANDSLLDVLDRISASAAGVQASLDPSQERVMLVSSARGQPMTLDSGTTGFFEAVQIEGGTYRARRRGGVSSDQASEITRALDRVSQAMNGVFGDAKSAPGHASVRSVRNAIASEALRHGDGSAGSERVSTDFGVELDFTRDRGSVFEFSAEVQRSFSKSLRADPLDVRDFFIDQVADPRDGFIGGLLPALERGERDLRSVLSALGASGSVGNLLDRFA